MKVIDLTGQKFGNLSVIQFAGTRRTLGGNSIRTWLCVCDCGEEIVVDSNPLRNRGQKSCGCVPNKGPPLELVGERFGKLVVVAKSSKNKSRQVGWNCKCDCGNEKVILGTSLVTGHTKSCGCSVKDRASTLNYVHGMSKTPEYAAWRAAISRCYEVDNKNFYNYGGRGIDVCDEWNQAADIGFIKFYEDMGPSNGLTLERVDVNLGYSKDNCIWEDYYGQNYNQRKRITNTSGKTGVSLSHGTWKAYIGFKGDHILLGSYATFEEAKSAREAAELKYYGKLKGH